VRSAFHGLSLVKEGIMDSRKIACLFAAIFIGAGVTAAAANAKPARSDVTVKAPRFDPETQRVVSYADLNLALRTGQKVLRGRISRTAGRLCTDLNYFSNNEYWGCRSEAIHSTDGQVAAAINRAKMKMAGKSVGPAVAISMVVGAR
jgi:UrcA family protein